ncbi:MAG: extracellular solute-binding protein [Candidatus Merdivicinus sp.]|jgi:putative aldouronate transport system substrate-binding protein
MKKTHRMLSVFLAAILLSTGMLGCSKNEEDQNQNVTSSPSSQSTENQQNQSSEEVVEVSALFQAPSETNMDNEALLKIAEMSNIKVNWELLPATSYKERFTVIMASNELPDLMHLSDMTLFTDCMDNGIIAPIQDALEGKENIAKYTDPSSMLMVTSEDGSIYGVPRNSVPRADGLIVRKDWMDKVGFDFPEDGILTIDEFTELNRAFAEDDPDGNGKKDTYGLTMRSTGGVLMPPPRVLTAFGSWDGFEIAPEGSEYKYMIPKYSKTDPSFVESLKYMNMLWTKGYIDPNWPANDGNSYMDRFQSGACGISACFGGWIGQWREIMLPNFPDVEFAYIYSIEGPDGNVKSRSTFGSNIYGVWCVSVNAEDKAEAVMRYFDTLLSDEGWDYLMNGVEGIHYNVENGKKVYTEAYQKLNTDRSNLALLRRYTDPSLWLAPHLPEEELNEMQTVIDKCIELVEPNLDLGYVPPAALETKYIDYQTTVDTTMSKIITGDLEPDAWYDMLDGWYEAGGKDYMDQMNEFIISKE